MRILNWIVGLVKNEEKRKPVNICGNKYSSTAISYRKTFGIEKQFSTSSNRIGERGERTTLQEERTSRSFHYTDQDWAIKNKTEDETSIDINVTHFDYTSKMLELNIADLVLIKAALSIAKEKSGFFFGPGQWLFDKVRKYLEVQETMPVPEQLAFNNAELLLLESALSIAIEESEALIGSGQLLYEKVKRRLETQGYRFNTDGTYRRV